MALINCPECNAQVSDKAAVCPNCGHPINMPAQEKGGGWKQYLNIGWMGLAVIVTILALFTLISTCKWAPL